MKFVPVIIFFCLMSPALQAHQCKGSAAVECLILKDVSPDTKAGDRYTLERRLGEWHLVKTQFDGTEAGSVKIDKENFHDYLRQGMEIKSTNDADNTMFFNIYFMLDGHPDYSPLPLLAKKASLAINSGIAGSQHCWHHEGGPQKFCTIVAGDLGRAAANNDEVKCIVYDKLPSSP